MNGETVDISTQDGVSDAYLSRPPVRTEATRVCCSSWTPSACRPRIEEMVDRIAARGFVVLAPNVLYRAGPASNVEMPDLEDPHSGIRSSRG